MHNWGFHDYALVHVSKLLIVIYSIFRAVFFGK